MPAKPAGKTRYSKITYIHTYIPAWTHLTYRRAKSKMMSYIHTYIHTWNNKDASEAKPAGKTIYTKITYIRIYIHTYIHTYMDSLRRAKSKVMAYIHGLTYT